MSSSSPSSCPFDVIVITSPDHKAAVAARQLIISSCANFSSSSLESSIRQLKVENEALKEKSEELKEEIEYQKDDIEDLEKTVERLREGEVKDLRKYRVI